MRVRVPRAPSPGPTVGPFTADRSGAAGPSRGGTSWDTDGLPAPPPAPPPVPPAAEPDPAAELRSSAYLRLLVLAALIGVPVAAAAYCFVQVDLLQRGVLTDYPRAIGWGGARGGPRVSAPGPPASPVHEPPRAVGWAATAERRRFGAPALAVPTSRSRRWTAEDTAPAG